MREFTGFCLFILFELFTFYHCSASGYEREPARLYVDASGLSARKIPETLFGLFFEEINHAGAGGLWAEFVDNRGFEKWGRDTPSNIEPWSIIGNDSYLTVSTDRSSYFERNKVALKMDIRCDDLSLKPCPVGGVGIWNPGFWGMNIEAGKTYKVVLYIRALQSVNVTISFTSSNGSQTLATANIISNNILNWEKADVLLKAQQTDHNSRLQLTTNTKGVVWFDQVSAMPVDTYKGRGFRTELYNMLADLKPGFLRFPGGCFVEGDKLQNAVHWEATIGPWENRPGHDGDHWGYWTDDGLGHFEFLQLAEDLGAFPVWVFNSGISLSLSEKLDPSLVGGFVQDILNGIEFAKGDPDSTWGSRRASMGHIAPFDLRYVAIGNEDCYHNHTQEYAGHYEKFYSAIKNAYPDIKIISNCESVHPADLYDYHPYQTAKAMFSMAHQFDNKPRAGPKVFVSEYAVFGPDTGNRGTLLAALAESGFLIGLEKNSDIVEMASYAPLFVNENDRKWTPDAIVFDSYQQYGTPSYWMQQFFKDSNGAMLLNSTLQTNLSSSLVASAILWRDSIDNKTYIRIKAVNFGSTSVILNISLDGLGTNSLLSYGSKKTVLTSKNIMDENSFQEPRKVITVESQLENANKDMEVTLTPYSLTSLDLLMDLSNVQIHAADPPSIHIFRLTNL